MNSPIKKPHSKMNAMVAGRSEGGAEPMTTGTLFWFTGLSGAGKTTLGREFLSQLNGTGRKAVFLDGDEMRAVFEDGGAHSKEDRRRLADRYSRLCKLLTSQGFDVVCCTISMFHSVREWNRKNIDSYFEVYVKAPMETLLRRDSKGIYGNALSKKLDNVVGLDIKMEEPLHPDLVVLNDGNETPAKIAKRILGAVAKGSIQTETTD